MDARQLCPVGWHVPSDDEWSILTTYLGGEAIAGGKMKITGTIESVNGLWHAPNSEASNSSGFSGIPQGDRNFQGVFGGFGELGFWWSSSEVDSNYAWNRYLHYNAGSALRLENVKRNGFSVRCLRD
jgi:uncharacterized protein (TIGR02145 family)